MHQLLTDIGNCTICKDHLPMGPRPVLQASHNSKIAIIGQAPGIRVHQSRIPWDDKSGERLRDWLGVSPEQFYDPDLFALVPMGFCYPGTGKSGDLPPRKECAPQWHEALWAKMKNVELILLFGTYAQRHYLESPKKNLTETVRNFADYLPKHIPLPHPSPRNNIWMKKNEWFAIDLLPTLKLRVIEFL